MLLMASVTFAEETKIDTTEYQNEVDDDLTIRNISYLPAADNIRGIYAKDIDKRLKQHIETNHHWEYIPSKLKDSKTNPEDLVGKPNRVKSFAKKLNADAFFSAETRKDPKGIQITLYLFSAKSGKLIAEERQKQVADNTAAVLATVDRMINLIRERIPYDGIILSRTDNRVTINLGQLDGVRVGQTLPTLKLVGAERHPKRDFVVKTHKALLGQIRVVKVDKHISFADIVSEKEPGVVARGVKVTGVSEVKYKSTQWTRNYTPPDILLSEDNKVLYGKKPRHWKPTNPPTFGRVGGRLGMGSFNNSVFLPDTAQTYSSQVPIYPKINIDAELWVNPNWYGQVELAQGIGSSQNPVGGQDLSQSLSQYRVSFGYNFLLRNDFFGPKISVDLGVSSYRMFVDSTTPVIFTTLNYTSLPFGVGGYVPVTKNGKWGIGGRVYFHMFPRLRESPVSSGDSSESSFNQIIFFAQHKYSERIRLNFGVEAMILSTSFSGAGSRDPATTGPAQNLSHRHILLTSGIDYLF